MAMRLLAFATVLPAVAALPSCQKARPPEKAPVASSSTVPSAAAPVLPPPPPGMVEVPAGSFTMGDAAGSPDAKPPHKVTISKAFFVDETEVTVGEYAKCVAAGGCTQAGLHGEDVKSDELIKFRKLCNSAYDDRASHPVNCVDQGQAAAYCAFAGKRLPTEAEWEYAARGTDGRTYPWGSEEPGCLKAVVSGCTKVPKNHSGTQAVGSFPNGKSAFGALDMAGNVWEWVLDAWNPEAYARGEQTDPEEKPTGALGVLRGGSWDFAPNRLKSTYRLKFKQTNGHVSTGLRCVQGGTDRPPPPTPQGKPLDCIELCFRECITTEGAGYTPASCDGRCKWECSQ